MLIENSNLKKDCLNGKTVLLTGGGGGIGYETARALAYLGANVIIAEIDQKKGIFAQNSINKELGSDKVWFYQADIGNEDEIGQMFSDVLGRYKTVDVLFNNATVTPLGPVDSVDIREWDRSYRVNLRAPILLIQKFLPIMKQRGSGVIVFVPSSGAAPFMGAYEVFKTAQVELCNTLVGEIENTEVIAYSIGPGLVKTETAENGIRTVAGLMGISTDEFYKMNEKQMLDAETAGTGFAISVALADRYNGQEIGSIQALIDGGIMRGAENGTEQVRPDSMQTEEFIRCVSEIVKVYTEQQEGWIKRNVFERQWILRDFKKTTGLSSDEMKSELLSLLERPGNAASFRVFELLKKYYERQYKLLQSYEKDPDQLKKNSDIVRSWIGTLDKVMGML
jgi:NAD(P)-dependent dehydrogenase (short-subunit alcohol dehydrogenase family)